ncbi:hypothetical protein CAEBREN_15304 [Caenorhabditis brenneri]|uniref:Kinase n=1 Tax=Caenorhabditis brenneri TaxID=135651 RepID=G0MHE3_CAEBE|nr:hypothetical protein CAEBREN_15304 [Caenorhabditis brenneri]
MEFDKQVAGRAKLSKILKEHVLKPTSVYEIESYRKLPKSVIDIAPDCCFIVLEGKLIDMKKCRSCESLVTVSTIKNIIKNHTESNFLIMKDASSGMAKPRLMDLKLGTRTYSDRLPKEKIEARIAKCNGNTTSQHGLRMCGARFTNKKNGEVVTWTKAQGKLLNREEFVDYMKVFFNVSQLQKDLLVSQLEKIKTVLENLSWHRFFGSSLLVLIDDEEELKVKIKLIDFASMARSEENEPQYPGVDTGAIFGVTNLIRILNE